MSGQNIPFNVTFHYDNNLHEIANNPSEMALAVQYLENQAAGEQDVFEKMKIWGKIGTFCRILGQLDKAEEYTYAALTAANQLGDPRAQVVNLIRLAHTYQWKERYASADRIFEQVIFICETARDNMSPGIDDTLSSYLDYAYQHMGKSKFDQRDYPRAAKFFQKALNLRKEKGDAELIESSAQALDYARQRMEAIS